MPLKNRKDAFERKFAHDNELRFRMRAHAAQSTALWAAELLACDQAATQNYINAALSTVLSSPNEAPLIKQLHEEFSESGHEISEREIELKFARHLEQAREHLLTA